MFRKLLASLLAALAVSWSCPANATIGTPYEAHRESFTASASTTTTTAALTTGCGVGDLMVVWVTIGSSKTITTTTLRDNLAANTFSTLGSGSNGSTRQYMGYSVLTTALTTSNTLSFDTSSSSGTRQVSVVCVTGSWGTTAGVRDTTYGGAAASTTNITRTSPALGANSVILFSSLSMLSPSTDIAPVQNGGDFAVGSQVGTKIQTSSSNAQYIYGIKYATGGSGLTPVYSMDQPGTRSWILMQVAFKETTSTVCRRTVLGVGNC